LLVVCFAALVCALIFAPGCNKGGGGGSGSTGPVKVKANFDQYNGDYDHALMVVRKSGDKVDGTTLVVARGCPSLACQNLGSFGYSEDWKKICPTGSLIVADLADRGAFKAGANNVTIALEGPHESSTLTGPTASPKLTVTDIGADPVSGSIDFKSDHGTFATGPFSAKVCPKS
jgi:hypothetical protein